MSSEWYYSQGGQQVGPITSQQLKDLAGGGQITPNDLVWKDGMPEWTPASRVKGLFGGAPASSIPQPGGYAANPQTAYSAPQAAYAAPQPAYAAPQAGYPAPQGGYDQGGQIGYYSATSDIGARTARILRSIPPVTGARGDWPLSDHHLAQFAGAEAVRKPIRSFYMLCRFMMLVCIIFSAIMAYALLQVMSSRFGRGPDMSTPLLIWLGITGLAVLYPLCGGAAMRCRVWGPITVLVLLAIGTIFTIYGLIEAMNYRYSRGPEIAAPLIALALDGLFIFITVRAMISMPKFLASPVWCVEAMINAKQ